MGMDTEVGALPVRTVLCQHRGHGNQPMPPECPQGWDSLCWKELCLCVYLLSSQAHFNILF